LIGVLEICATEWGLDPLSIYNNWTDELLWRMIGKFVERKEREAKAYEGAAQDTGDMISSRRGGDVVVRSPEQFARLTGLPFRRLRVKGKGNGNIGR